MLIQSTHSNKLTLGNRGQVSRRDRYRSELKISEQDRRDHLAIDWRPEQTPSSLLKREGDRYTVSNFRWGFDEVGQPGDWKPDNDQATVDVSKVKNVYLAIEPFAPEIVAGHGLMVFEMENDSDVSGPNGKQDVGFAVSVEARRPVGKEYGLVSGMKKNFGMIYQLGSLSDQIQKVTRQRGHKLVLHRIELDDEQKKKLAQDALDASVEDRLGEWYHTLTNSCFTAGVDLVNGVVPEDQKMARWTKHLRFSRLNTSLPALAGATLKSKGLLAEEPITFLNPDPNIWPEKQGSVGALKKGLAYTSRSALFKPALAVAGAGAGGAVGYAIGNCFGEIGGYIGAGLGALSGLGTGSYTADVIATKTDQKPTHAEQWYMEKSGVSREEARRRLSSQD